MFKKFKKLETSKKLITIVTIIWILSIIIGFVGLSFGFDFITIVNVVNLDFLVILGYYFTKAGTENVVKLVKKNLETKESEENIYDKMDSKNELKL